MTLAEAEVHILTILKQIMEEKLTSVNIQVGCVTYEEVVCTSAAEYLLVQYSRCKGRH